MFFFSLYHFFTVVGCSVPQDTAGQQDLRQTPLSISCCRERSPTGRHGEEGKQRQLDPGPYFYARFQRVLLGISCWQEGTGRQRQGGKGHWQTGRRGGGSHAGRQAAATCMRTLRAMAAGIYNGCPRSPAASSPLLSLSLLFLLPLLLFPLALPLCPLLLLLLAFSFR